jgi:hypothetical protein
MSRALTRRIGAGVGFLVVGAGIAASGSACSSSPGVRGTEATDERATGAARRYEAASVEVPVGDTCDLHPEGNRDPRGTIRLVVDSDRVARFSAVRPTQAGDPDRLVLDCTDAAGNAQRYPVDLRSEATFATRPFDPVSGDAEIRPALSGDPLGYDTGELIRAGYGLRPDPQTNPGGYARWLGVARRTAYLLKPQPGRAAALPPLHAHQRKTRAAPASARPNAGPVSVGSWFCEPPFPGCYWTGAVMSGSYDPYSPQGTLTTQGVFYVSNEATFNLPKIQPGGYDTGNTAMSIWTGLDNVFQAVTWVQTTATTANVTSVFMERNPDPDNNAEPTNMMTLSPSLGDDIYAEEWYCDAKGIPDIAGGYGCAYVVDTGKTGSPAWSCISPTSTGCHSYTIGSGETIGTQAEYILENDSPQSGASTYDWPDFEVPITMTGTATVENDQSGQPQLTAVGVAGLNADPYVLLLTDTPPAVGWPVGTQRVDVSIPSADTVEWTLGTACAPMSQAVACTEDVSGVSVTMTCGDVPDGCGGFVSCGTCSGDEVCDSGHFCSATHPTCKFPQVYCASTRRCIPEFGYCPR